MLDKQPSPLDFHVYERPAIYIGKDGDEYETGYKALVRMVDDKPVSLGVVKNTYKVVQNKELFDLINDEITKAIGTNDAHIVDKTSYHGAVSLRDYRFNHLNTLSPDGHPIKFRIIVQNGFGTGAVKLYAGAIDAFCTNGMILGEYGVTYAKHSSGLEIKKFGAAVQSSIDIFWKHKDYFAELKHMSLFYDRVRKWLNDNFGERLGGLLHQVYLEESRKRGPNMWALYSALTYYASHEAFVPPRKTKNDHAASTMIERENKVYKLFHDRENVKFLTQA